MDRRAYVNPRKLERLRVHGLHSLQIFLKTKAARKIPYLFKVPGEGNFAS